MRLSTPEYVPAIGRKQCWSAGGASTAEVHEADGPEQSRVRPLDMHILNSVRIELFKLQQWSGLYSGSSMASSECRSELFCLNFLSRLPRGTSLQFQIFIALLGNHDL